jgi:hypothetical protein
MRSAMLSIPVMLLLLSSSGLARADYVSNAAASCRGVTYGQSPIYTPFATNANPYSIHVVCPLSMNSTSSSGLYFNSVMVKYNDASPTDAFYCWTEFTSFAGDPIPGTPMYTCDQDGGCPTDSDALHTGQGYYLNLDLPSGAMWIDDSVAVHCVIPKPSNGQASGLYVLVAG